MKNARILLLAALILSLLAIPSFANDVQTIGSEKTAKVYWKVATLAPKGIGYSLRFEEVLLPAIEAETQGMLALKIYWGGVMGDDTQVLKKMHVGQLDGGGLSGQGTFLLAPEIPVLGLPFLFRDWGEVDYVKEHMIDDFDAICMKQGFKLLLWLDQDFDQIYSSNTPIGRLSDFKKARFVTWFGPLEGRFLEMLGSTPIPMNVAEIPSSMRSGVADAMIAPSIWIVGTQLYTVFKYVNPVRIRYVPAFVVVTENAFNSVDDIRKKRLEETRLDLAQDFCTRSRVDAAECLQAMLKYGMREVKSTPAQLEKIEKTVHPVWDELAGKLYPKELLDEIVKNIDEYRALQGDQCPAE